MGLMLRTLCLALSLAMSASVLSSAQHPRDKDIHDADTLSWWHTTEALSGDSMEGRDTGSPAYHRAAEYVAHRFELAGLKPAGDNGTWFQRVPMHEIRLEPTSTIRIKPDSGDEFNLRLMHDISPSGFVGVTHAEGDLVLAGTCTPENMNDVKGRIVLCMGGRFRTAAGTANARKAGAAGVLTVDDPYYTAEPVSWPLAYARSVTIRQSEPSASPKAATPVFSGLLNAAVLTKLLQGTSYDATDLLQKAHAGQSLPTIPLKLHLTASLQISERDIESDNVLAILPGTDATLKSEYLALNAHLDGYGRGEAVNGDSLYNGAFDDAAYVALLTQFAEDMHRTGKAQGDVLQRPKRSILFCVFTGEEKGLLGARWFVDHMTVPKQSIIADINLDQLRPLFPLHTLTQLAIHDTTLGATAQQVGASMGITVREDREPERGLLRRADHYPFLQAGIPATGFIFAFEPGTEDERRYREWYRVRYHKPQDDLTQPIDFDAARKFNQFFYALSLTVANASQRPEILAGSSFQKH
jgi:Zn-dependent M28 family amino/carboxypeptidase